MYTSSTSKGISTKIDLSKKVKFMDKTIMDAVNNKQLEYDLAQHFIEFVNQFVPKNTGELQKHGYNLQLGNKNKKGPWFRITYRNTKKLPYVMYQYYGTVWGPNYAKFGVKGVGNDLTMRPTEYEHIGWSSPPEKYDTGRPFRRRKKSFRVLRGRYKGTLVTINGYTTNKRKVEPMWLEYAREKFVMRNTYSELAMQETIRKACLNALKK